MKPKKKMQYNVYVWDADADNTETVFEAPAKPTLEQMYKLIGCDRVERVSGYDKSVSNRTFDIWIDEIYINQESKVNKFLAENNSNFEPFSYITIKLLYTTKLPVKKPEPLW